MTGPTQGPQSNTFRQINVNNQMNSFNPYSLGNAGDVTLYDLNASEWDQLGEGLQWGHAWENPQQSDVPTISNTQSTSNSSLSNEPTQWLMWPSED